MKKILPILLVPLVLVALFSYTFATPPTAPQTTGVLETAIDTLAELNGIVGDATLLDDGAIADSNAIGLATGATHSLFGAAGDDTIDEMFTAIDTAFASYSLTTAIPLDSDFTSNGLMERTGAGTYQTATSISLAARAASPEWLLRDSDSAGTANTEDEDAASLKANQTTDTDENKISAWGITSFGADAVNTEYVNLYWDSEFHQLEIGTQTDAIGPGSTTDPATVANRECLAIDTDYATDNWVQFTNCKSTSNLAGIHFAGLNLLGTGTLGAGAITGTSLTDSTATLTGGAFTGVASLTNASLKLAVDAAAYLNIATANAGQTTISQVSDGAGVGTDAGIILGVAGNSVVTRLEGGEDSLCNGCYSGQVIEGINAGADVAQGTAVFLAADSKFDPADADLAGAFPAWGIAVECKGGPDWPCQDTEAITILVKGVYRDDDFTQFDVDGDVLYLGDGITVTTSLYDESAVPATANDCVQVMGMVINDDHIYVNVSPNWLLVE